MTYPIPEAWLDTTGQPATTEAPTITYDQEEHIRNVEPEQISTYTPTPLTSDAPSEAHSTQPTTPSSAAQGPISKAQQTPTQSKSRPVAPIIPALPVLPPSPTAARKGHRDSVTSSQSKNLEETLVTNDRRPSVASTSGSNDQTGQLIDAPAPRVKPTSWANLFRNANLSSSSSRPNNDISTPVNGLVAGRGEALSDVLQDVDVTPEQPSQVSFLQPRGLVNTGNMCYMNSVSCFLSP